MSLLEGTLAGEPFAVADVRAGPVSDRPGVLGVWLVDRAAPCGSPIPEAARWVMVGVAPFAGARVELARIPNRLLGGRGRLEELPAAGGVGRIAVEIAGPGTALAGEVPFTLCASVSAPVPSADFAPTRVTLPGPPAPFEATVGVPAGWTPRPGVSAGETMWFAEDGTTRFTVAAECPGACVPASFAADARASIESDVASHDAPANGSTSEVLRLEVRDEGLSVLWTSGGAAFPERLHADVLWWGRGAPAIVRCSLETMPYFPEVAEAALAACGPSE